MNPQPYSPLVTIADDLTQTELIEAPELPTLIALDASLMATLNLLDHSTPYLGYFFPQKRFKPEVDDHLAHSICILANALRGNLAAYYAAVQDICEEKPEEAEVNF